MADLDYESGSDNVYQDLGYDDSAEMKIKANGVRVLAKLINTSGMTQQEVADILGIDQPKISRILHGNFRGLSMEKVMSYILALGNDIDITVSEKDGAEPVGHLHFHAV